MIPITSTEHIRSIDQLTIEQDGLAGVALMESAGAQVCALIQKLWQQDLGFGHQQPKRVLVFCGAGNNGGDGFVIARHLASLRHEVQVYCTRSYDRYQGDAAVQLQVLRASGLEPVVLDESILSVLPQEADLVVDALLGTGARSETPPLYRAIFSWINARNIQTLSVDVPSGLDADGVFDPDVCVDADVTASLGALKAHSFFHPHAAYSGRTEWISLGYPPHRLHSSPFQLLQWDDHPKPWLQRRVDGHKGSSGKCLIWAGSEHYLGAAVLTAKACLKTGAGMVQLACPKDVASTVAAQHPELLILPLPSEAGQLCDSESAVELLKDRLDWADAFILGPGLGQDEQVKSCLLSLLEHLTLPTVVDADALNLIAATDSWSRVHSKPWILTPHAKEAERCFGVSQDRGMDHLERCRALAMEHAVTIHFKGAPSCTALPQGLVLVNGTGNPLLSVAGSGDVLAGIMGALLSQGYELGQAASFGALLHGQCAEALRSSVGEHGHQALDIISVIPHVLNS